MSSKLFLLILFALCISSPVYALGDRSNCPDQWADPAHDICNPLRYIPNKALNILAAALFFLVAIILTIWAFKRKANYFLAMVIGAWAEGVGFVLRVILRKNVHSVPLYVVCNLFIILSPCAFLAADYVLLGRLVQHLNAHECIRPLKAKRISLMFIMSDVTTFIIQAIGGALAVSQDKARLGGHILLAGIVAQMVSFVFFTIVCFLFGLRVRSQAKDIWTTPGWKALYSALLFTCICFLIRSVYRTVELAQGYVGYLATHEAFLLGLDSLPLLLGIASYAWFWPGRYLRFDQRMKGFENGVEMR
ncbi:hypothetical protein L202_00386 [Cryptococcus amylolentus CBS 6039]|uniref:Uncharacterized protein n=2 Tax=Cryptococcus amylolentus TaxID=104669 RepID=A0A1E3I9B6_9TREE|nr:hypothetical protein L202_00386 [Cryptococcus amylolentus CBS 6039]ODN84436.1 hypothetical protein L202_00386 [Cryptococcus amylolentus CBS 6039]ODO11760.1 hypothetical protein I350_00544 [Cryptococcus amylolentus CBS 6273]